ncbi:MAG: ABC transporter ATP-binding protein [Eubacteriales bacterium]|nr:ABC transporter ATP-binding protein [Eubacteriales bacterium]
MKRIYYELSPFKKQIFLLFLCVIGYTASNLALPYYLSNIVNLAIPAQDKRAIFIAGGIMLLFLSFGVFCQIMQSYLAAISTVGLAKNLRSLIFAKAQYFSQSEFDTFTTSSLITRTNNDVVQVQQFLAMFLRISLLAPIMFLGGIIMTLIKSPKLSLVLLVSMPILVLFVAWMAKKAMPLSAKMQEKLDYINLITREKLKGIRVARSFNMENYEETRFQKSNEDFTNYSIRMNTLISLAMPVLILILYLTMVAVVGIGGFQILQSATIPVGDIIAVIQYITQIMMAVMMLSMLFVMYPRASVSATRLKEVLDTENSVLESETSSPFPTDDQLTLRFEDVSFRFPHAESYAISGISFTAQSGQVTAIIGSTGSGKSTLIDLIPRFYDVSTGKITINDIDIRQIALSSLREKIGYIPQKAFLFRGSIAENIDFTEQNLSQESLEEVLHIAQSHDFVMAKDDQLETKVSQSGLNFSGGQKQRLAIARAIAKNPDIYIFDDSFSALDFKTDAMLRRALLEHTKNAVVLIVAQRISTIKNADRILVLEDGKIVGSGKHEALLKDCEVYREIVYSQLEKEEV